MTDFALNLAPLSQFPLRCVLATALPSAYRCALVYLAIESSQERKRKKTKKRLSVVLMRAIKACEQAASTNASSSSRKDMKSAETNLCLGLNSLSGKYRGAEKNSPWKIAMAAMSSVYKMTQAASLIQATSTEASRSRNNDHARELLNESISESIDTLTRARINKIQSVDGEQVIPDNLDAVRKVVLEVQSAREYIGSRQETDEVVLGREIVEAVKRKSKPLNTATAFGSSEVGIQLNEPESMPATLLAAPRALELELKQRIRQRSDALRASQRIDDSFSYSLGIVTISFISGLIGWAAHENFALPSFIGSLACCLFYCRWREQLKEIQPTART